jgi:hypothetical protein
MHLPEFAPCAECGFFHGTANRDKHQPIHERLRDSDAVEFTGDTSLLSPGALILDKDGDVWHFIRHDNDESPVWDCQSNDTDFTCKQYEKYREDASSVYPGGTYAPHYLVSDGRPNIPVPSFTSVEEAEAWLEAHA